MSSSLPGRPRIPRILTLVVALALPFSGCSLLGDDEGQKAVDGFADALGRKDAAAAAGFTTDPVAAQVELQRSFDGVGETRISARVPELGDRRSGRHEFSVDWTVPAGATVTTTGALSLSADGTGDRIEWTPAILDARLATGGRLVYADALDYDTPVVDRNGIRILGWAPVTRVVLAPGSDASAGEVAATVSGADPSITADSVRAGAATDPASPYTVVSLRKEDLDPIRGRLAAIPGVTLTEQGRLLTSDRRIHSPAFAGLPDLWLDTLKKGAGWSLNLVNPTGTVELGGRRPEEVTNIGTTIDVALQSAAQKAVDAQSRPAAIVALEPTTGGVLAVAQNAAADRQGPIALTGLFPPGSTFKTVTTAAALDAGITSSGAILPCPGRDTIEGRSIPNDSEFALGSVPLHTAFAQSCNTTQGRLAVQLGPTAMKDTAAKLGFGVDFTTPGLTTVTGSVPVTDGGAARVEAAIGQGTVVASPFGLAVMEASLAADGRMILPSLVRGRPATANARPEPLRPDIVTDLRTMMRETVTSGTATALRDIEGLGGKTGTAEVGDGPAHGWFAGIVGDIAFSTFVEGGDSSAPAVAASGTFLRSAGEALRR